MVEPFNVKINIAEIELFKSLTKYIASLAIDERLPLEIRLEIMGKLEKITEVK